MSTYKLKEMFHTRSEIKRAVWFARKQYTHCRAGQAFCLVYLKDKQTWPELFYEEDQEKVLQMLHDHCAEHNAQQLWIL
jgi:hypothetical protein